MLSGIYSASMDIATVRATIARAFEESGETQEAFAARAGLRQGHLAKWLDLTVDMTEIRARVLFDVVERGLRVSLSSFFARIEALQAGTELPENGYPVTRSQVVVDDSRAALAADPESKARALRWIADMEHTFRIARLEIEKLPDSPVHQGEHDANDRHPADLRAIAAERHPRDRELRPRRLQRTKTRGPKPKRR